MTLHSPALLKKSDQPYLTFRTSESTAPVGPVEVELFEFKGRPWTLTAIAPSGNYSGKFRIDGGLYRPLAIIDAPDMKYPCVHVEDGIVFVYGSSEDHSRISMMRSTDLVNWTAPVVVFTATAGMGFYNTSVAKHTMSGKYRMMVETTDPSYPANHFVVHLLGATNPAEWTMLPPVFKNDSYVNCPVVRYVGDTLYMLYMALLEGNHTTVAARSIDHGVTWSVGFGADGQTAALFPSVGEGNNNSDATICEFGGETFLIYGRGNQESWLECTSAVYPGTMKQFFEQFFPAFTIGNLLPAMTGDTVSGVTISASGMLATTAFHPWKAADRAPSTFWHSPNVDTFPCWWRVDFETPKSVVSYSIKCRAGFPAQGPKNCVLQGFDGAAWVTLDARSGQTYQDGVAKKFILAGASAPCTAFRLVIDSNVEGSVNVSIGEIEIHGY
jgi:hypothetical protein